MITTLQINHKHIEYVLAERKRRGIVMAGEGFRRGWRRDARGRFAGAGR